MPRRARKKRFNTFEPVRLTLTPLSKRGKEVLELLGAGNPPSKVAKALGVGKSAITYWVKKLKRLGYIRLQMKDVFHTYDLTHLGSKVLTGSEKAGRVVVLEDYPVKYGVVEWEETRVDWRKLGEPRNWAKYGFKVGGVRVVKTSRSIIVHPGQLRGYDPFWLVYVATRECDRVAAWLVDHLGMVLANGEPVHKPIIQIYDPLAEEISRYYTLRDDVGGVDRSPPSSSGHWEMGPSAAKDFLSMPFYVRQLWEIQSAYAEDIRRHLHVYEGLEKLIQEVRALVKELRGVKR